MDELIFLAPGMGKVYFTEILLSGVWVKMASPANFITAGTWMAMER